MEPQNPYGAPKELSVNRAPTIRLSRKPLAWFCVAFYGLAILWGARSAVASERSASDFVFQVVLAMCLGIWAVTDARQREKPIPRSQQFWFLILAWLVVPGYVIVTRGWKGLGWIALNALSWFAIATLAMHITGFIYYGDAWWPVLGFED